MVSASCLNSSTARRARPRHTARLDQPDVEVVLCLTPPDWHAEIALEAIAAGRYVYTEKPLGVTREDPEWERLRDAFLDYYAAALAVYTRLFAGGEDALTAIEARGLDWGIVTNKAARFTLPLLERLGIAARAGIVVCGDTTPQTKPHPAPLLHAAAGLGVVEAHVGLQRRDVGGALIGDQRVDQAFVVVDDPVGVQRPARPAQAVGRRALEHRAANERRDGHDRRLGRVQVVLQDERLSSHEAEGRLASTERDWRVRKQKLDAAAAAVILQDYLDAHVPARVTHDPDA